MFQPQAETGVVEVGWPFAPAGCNTGRFLNDLAGVSFNDFNHPNFR
jgi:hypothetical protein